jgi:hypothetical protein
MELSWQNVSNEQGYRIYQWFVDRGVGLWQQVATTNANVTRYSADALTPNTTYYFKVAAYNQFGESHSDWKQATTGSSYEPGIYVIGHRFLSSLPYWHTTILFVRENGSWTTFGAEGTPNSLVSDPNRPSDNPFTGGNMTLGRVRTPAGVSLTSAIQQIIDADRSYNDMANYTLNPGGIDLGPLEYNSNSYARGLLSAAGLSAPTLILPMGNSAPGYEKPLPFSSYRRAG